jgi:hypothetical protein
LTPTSLGPTIEDLTRDRIVPAATLIALVTLAASLLMAFRRLRLAETPGLAALREVRLFRLSYPVTGETGHLEPDGRSGRRRSLRTAAGRRLPWRNPAGAAGDDPGPEDRLTALAAGGRIVASFNHTSQQVHLHERDLAVLHGLGRRGRGLIVLPVFLATLAFVVVTRAALQGFLLRNAASSAPDLWLSVAVAGALFAFTLLIALAIAIGGISAVFRRVRRAQLRRDHEPALRALLAEVAQKT